MKVTKEQQRKMDRKARRDIEIEEGKRNFSHIHKTSKKDKMERKKNTIRPEEIE